MRSTTKKVSWIKGALVAGAMVAAVLSAGANAALITQWSFYNESGLRDPTWFNNIPGTVSGNSGLLGEGTKFSWGTNAPGSSIEVGPAIAAGTIFTNGAAAGGVQLTHNNFPINTPPELTGGTLDDLLILTPVTPPGLALGPFLANFSFVFTESPNDPPSGGCEDGTLRSVAPNAPKSAPSVAYASNRPPW